MPRFLGIDYGPKRIGIALSDPEGRIASPERILPGCGSADGDAAAVVRLAEELEAREFVVGLPLHMDGSDSEQTARSRAFAQALAAQAPGPVHLFDERLTSHAADALLAQRQLTRKKRKQRQDAVAAAVLLGGFLEERRRLGTQGA